MRRLLIGQRHAALLSNHSFIRRRYPLSELHVPHSTSIGLNLLEKLYSLDREKVQNREQLNVWISPCRTFNCSLSGIPTLHKRRLHSSSSSLPSNGSVHARVTPKTTSVNLSPLISTHVLTSIQHFPEVTAVLAYMNKTAPTINKSSSLQMYQGLDRTLEVLAGFDMEDEIQAVRMLQIYLDVESCDYSRASTTLDTMLLEMEANEDRLDYTFWELQLAQSKVSWLQGDFEISLSRLNALLKMIDVTIGSDDTSVGKVLLASVWNAKAILLFLLGDQYRAMAVEASQTACLLLDSELEKECEKFSSKAFPLKLITAAFYMNLGLIEMSKIPSSKHKEVDMKSWEKSLKLIEDYKCQMMENAESKEMTCELADWIHAHILCMMTHALLFPPTSKSSHQLSESELHLASEHSGKALSIYDSWAATYTNTCTGDEELKGAIPVKLKRSIGRALSIVASCYARAGSLVTAEGLFQSALDSLLAGSSLPRSLTIDDREEILLRKDLDPITQVNTQMCLLEYARLCQSWERRESDAKRYEGLAEELTYCFPGDWVSKGLIKNSAIYSKSSLELINGGAVWFFSVNDFK